MQSSYTVLEGQGMLTVCANITGRTERPVQLTLSTQSVSAKGKNQFGLFVEYCKVYLYNYQYLRHQLSIFSLRFGHIAGIDYVEASINLNFEPSDVLSRTKCFTITILDDSGLDEEPIKFFQVLLNTTDDKVVITSDEAMVMIWDDDSVIVSLVELTADVSEGMGNVTICAILVGTIERSIQVMLNTIPETAQGLQAIIQ